MKNWLLEWQKFWFESERPFAQAIFRIGFSFTLLVMYGLRSIDLEFLFSDKSMVPASQAKDLMPAFFRPSFYWFSENFEILKFNHAIYLLLILCILVGFGGRLFVLFAYILHLSFMQRNYSVVYGADIVSCFWYFSLMFMNANRVLSVDQYLLNRFGFRGIDPIAYFKGLDSDLSSVGRRTLQIQLCILYGYTGLEKLRGSTWWNGTAVWEVLANQQIMMFDLSFMRGFPVIVAMMTISSFLFEIYFPALVWSRIRKWVLFYGILLHLGIAIGMGLVFFSFVMISAYALWLENPKAGKAYSGF